VLSSDLTGNKNEYYLKVFGNWHACCGIIDDFTIAVKSITIS
jgi:hypothetical protein